MNLLNRAYVANKPLVWGVLTTLNVIGLLLPGHFWMHLPAVILGAYQLGTMRRQRPKPRQATYTYDEAAVCNFVMAKVDDPESIYDLYQQSPIEGAKLAIYTATRWCQIPARLISCSRTAVSAAPTRQVPRRAGF